MNENLNNNENKDLGTANSQRTYTAVSMKQKRKINFARNILTPFAFGILGCMTVLGICIHNPTLQNSLKDTFSNNVASNTILNNSKNISLPDYSSTAISVANKVLPSIVGIKVEYQVNAFFYGTSTSNAEGSGIILSEDGYILTNNHIVNTSSNSSYYDIEKANKITVFLYNDETEYEAKIVGKDSQTDLAIIKIDKSGLTAATLGDSDSLQVGEFAMAIGNPLGMQSSVTSGIISALNRTVTDTNGTEYTLIQTDAAINSGNSGGALVNCNGEVVGLNTLKLSGTGIEGMGFAIPINATLDVTDELITYNKVRRPFIGIGGINITEELSKQNNLKVGIYVKTLEDFSSAEKAGVKVGDIITAINGEEVKTMDKLNEIKNNHEIGDKITLTIFRENEELKIDVVLGEAPSDK
ncbi:MAG: trypsin-like peptidase domain-containing protein [Clostridia bacterium]|nr:trypsin-like peptidase domain-containing protein [Clostridia bacterium]